MLYKVIFIVVVHFNLDGLLTQVRSVLKNGQTIAAVEKAVKTSAAEEIIRLE